MRYKLLISTLLFMAALSLVFFGVTQRDKNKGVEIDPPKSLVQEIPEGAPAREKQRNEGATLELLGTVISRLPGSGQRVGAYALIENLATQKTGIYQLREDVNGWTLVDISVGNATLLKEGRKTTLWVENARRKKTVIELSPTERIVSQEHLTQEVKNLHQSWQEVVLIPYIEEGAMRGFKVGSIDEKSILNKMGILKGDILQEINGQPIHSFQEATQVAQALRKEIQANPTVSVKIQRDKKPCTLTYTLY